MMGKVRKEKKHRTHQKGPAATRKRVQISTPLEGVVPLTEDIMKCEALLSLKAAIQDKEKEPGKKKKERMKVKREHWLQSASVYSTFSDDPLPIT